MPQNSILPAQWRAQQNLSQADLARSLGIRGKNPARTWQRWEAGEREPPLTIIVRVEAMSNGIVTAASWIAARIGFQNREITPRPRKAIAEQAAA